MADAHFYPIGVKGVPWGQDERVSWRAQHQIQRSYKDQVLSKVYALRESGKFVVEQYGALSCDPQRCSLARSLARARSLSLSLALSLPCALSLSRSLALSRALSRWLSRALPLSLWVVCEQMCVCVCTI
jgi:hypothetical protein